MMLTCLTDKDINILQQNINELKNVSLWLCSNKLSLNVEKSNCSFSFPAKKTYLGFSSNFRKQVLESERCIKYCVLVYYVRFAIMLTLQLCLVSIML